MLAIERRLRLPAAMRFHFILFRHRLRQSRTDRSTFECCTPTNRMRVPVDSERLALRCGHAYG